MINYWYSAKPHEIFLDLDSQRALHRAMSVLSIAIQEERLHVKQVYLFPTTQKNHFHLIIVLESDLHQPQVCRLAWSLWLGNDRLRAAYVLFRMCDPEVWRRSSGDLLVSRGRMYHRKPDAECECHGKHKEETVTSQCPAMSELLGASHSADYFARTGPLKNGRKTTRFEWGRIPLKQILKWEKKRKDTYGRERQQELFLNHENVGSVSQVGKG